MRKMPDFPAIGASIFESGVAAATSGGVVLTANASPNVKATSFTEIIAATAFDAQLMLVNLGYWASGPADYLIDIAIGAASSEVVIAANLIFSGFTNGEHVAQYQLPIFVPAGTRLSARCQASAGSATVRCTITLMAQPFLPSAPLSVVTTYGANTGDSGGVSIDAGGSANAKGSYSQLAAALSFDTSWLIVAVAGINATRTACRWLLDVAVGAAASETIVIPDLYVVGSSASDSVLPATYCLPCSLPAGSRVAIRSQCSITDATDRLLDCVIYGVS
jgi:hypothetical protein